MCRRPPQTQSRARARPHGAEATGGSGMYTSGSRDRLAQQVVGSVLDGDDPAAAAEAAGFNTAVTHRPAVVVAAQSADDVASAVRFARENGLPVAVQATGHGAVAPA